MLHVPVVCAHFYKLGLRCGLNVPSVHTGQVDLGPELHSAYFVRTHAPSPTVCRTSFTVTLSASDAPPPEREGARTA